jgi:hypothetical protein
MKEKTYYEALFEESPKEKAINEEIDKEMESFENSPEYLAHKARINALLQKLKEAQKEHHDEVVKKYRKPEKVKPAPEKEIKKRKEAAKQEYPKELTEAIESFKRLDPKQQDLFFANIRGLVLSDYRNFENPITTKENVKQLLEILVQTTIDYINENKLTDIDTVSFSADGLQASAKEGKWVCFTDGSIRVYGLGSEKFEGKTVDGCMQLIGEYY